MIWFHAPSVGEGLQARPVIETLRASHPGIQLAYTFFSPSAEKFARSLPVDFSSFLPFDTTRNARSALDALRPDALIYSKLDVWPLLTREAGRRGIPVALISATVAPRSRRLNGIARAFLHDAYASLRAVGAIDDANAGRLAELGVDRGRITLMGDTRFDQVWGRALSVRRDSGILAELASRRQTLVAGSTWPSDLEVLLPAWEAVLRSFTHGDETQGLAQRAGGGIALPEEGLPRIIIAPHEPTPRNIRMLSEWASGNSLSWRTLDHPSGGGRVAATADEPMKQWDQSADVILVNRVGVLGDLYSLGSAAYVGGGFHAAGLHSVIEPAAFGIPVFFGPGNDMSREAGLLLAAGGGQEVKDAIGLQREIVRLFSDNSALEAAGANARTVVESELGATGRAVSIILSLLGH